MTFKTMSNAVTSKFSNLLRYTPRSTPTTDRVSPTTASSGATPSSAASSKRRSSLTEQVKSSLSSALPSFSSLSSIPFISSLPSLPTFESLSRHALQKEVLSQSSPYDALTATVERRSHTLSQEESDYLTRRREQVLPHLRQLIPDPSLSSSSAPSVAICLSGGGCRAMLGSLSALSTLNSLGLLSSSTYCSGLSGSTWAMSQIYSRPPPSSSSSLSTPIDFPSILDRVRSHIALPLLPRQSSSLDQLMPIIKRSIVDKLNFSSQSLTITDVLAWFISHRILSTITHDITPTPSPSSPSSPDLLSSLTLSSQRDSLSSFSLPFPLYTAVTSPSMIQFEFSPYHVGSWELSSFIPTWSFNRPFDGGKSTNPIPREPHLSTLLSVFSSAHCTDLASQLTEMAWQMKGQQRLKEGVKELVERMKREWRLKDVHPFDAIQFHSFLHNLPSSSSPPLPPSITSSPTLSLMDAGLAFNFPLTPLVQPARAVDVIVLIDFTSPPEAMNGQYLETAKRYCDAHGLKLPRWVDGRQPLGRVEVKEEESADKGEIRRGEGLDGVENKGKGKKSAEVDALYRACHSRVTVFEGGVGVPTIVYVPLLSNERYDRDFCPRRVFESGGFTATLNFVYTREESGKLMGLVEANLRESAGVITEAIRDKWRAKDANRHTM